jgi:uncharacterized protein (DUF427 family)
MINRKQITPGPGQESVWDYPRPPRVEDSPKHIQVIFNGIIIADTYRAKRVLETSHPPVYYSQALMATLIGQDYPAPVMDYRQARES